MHQVARRISCGKEWEIASKKNLRAWDGAHQGIERSWIACAGSVVILALYFVEHSVGSLRREVFGKEPRDSVRQHGHGSPTMRKNKVNIWKFGESTAQEETFDRPGRVE